ncbi:MAG: EthD domain-containing protein [Deltaproteobacteria bacterium]|nr:EthD domain-containing protein [Deltaproteobacteria bacterium]
MKALINLVPRSGTPGSFESRVREIAQGLRESPDAQGAELNVMLRIKDDPFGRRTQIRAAIELIDAEATAASLANQLQGLDRRLEDLVHVDLSSLLVGEDVVFIACRKTPIRYQYLMRRNASFSHESYLKRYRDVHSRFGIETPGISGYTQFHVDPEASRRAARSAGFGVWAVDSVSELHLESVETFLAEVSQSSIGVEALADEEVFVDRANSYDFVSRIE